MHSQEPEIAYVARLHKTAAQMGRHIRDFEVAKGTTEHSRADFVPIAELETLLVNQGDLLSANPRKYETDDPTKLLLLDDNIGELIGGGYEALTGRQLGKGVVTDLNKSGWEIKIADTSVGRKYYLPTSF